MANNYIFIISCWIFLLEVNLGIVSQASEEAKKILEENRLLPKTKGTIKTIECPEDGVVIDCIDFWQQPAFDNPITKKLQLMEPTMRNPTDFGSRNDSKIPRRYHKWNKYGECPKETIPIRRTRKNNDTMLYRKYPKGGVSNQLPRDYATIDSSPGSTYYGSSAILNIWKPYVVTGPRSNDMTLAQLWVASEVGGRQNLNSIEAGWMVYPRKHEGSTQPRFFILWTRDGYRETHCYNIDPACPGFVLIGQHVTLDCDIDLTSVYDGDQYEVSISIQRRSRNGNWYLYMNGAVLGYWPANILTTLPNGADRIAWGGEVAYKPIAGHHTTTQMGSGHFPSEDFNRAAYFRVLKAREGNNDWINLNPVTLIETATEPGCYDVQLSEDPDDERYNTYFLYGGPGGLECNL